MTSDKQKKINNNNRKRGGAFEKRVADYLDMDVVPYSGSNARFGYGDVRDSIWLGECKNITPDGNKVTIRMEWFEKNEVRAKGCGRIPYLAWMPAGRATKFIILDIATFTKLDVLVTRKHIIENKVHNTRNLIIHIDELYVKVASKMGEYVGLYANDMVWVMMSIGTFRDRINKIGLKGTRGLM
jgi:hypothetical protein